MEYAAATDWLYGTQLFGVKLGLENVDRMCEAWRLPGECGRIVHVAGTNGKGSVSALIESVCGKAGYRTGLFTSPHLVSFRERIRVEGEMIGEARVAELLTELRELVSEWDPHPTFFELTTVLGLRHFRDSAVEVVVLETGLGGRLDATNTGAKGLGGEEKRVVSVITPIALDHEKWLGKGLGEIAMEKAGIMREGVPVVSARQEAEVVEVLRGRAEEVGTEIRFLEAGATDFEVGLFGRHQRENAALAIAALEGGGIQVPQGAVARGLKEVRWRGRFERVAREGGGEIILDGAHNPEAARALAATWREEFGEEKGTIVLGLVESKDAHGILCALAPIAERFLFVPVNSPRSMEPEGLARALSGTAAEVECARFESAAQALEAAEKEGSRRVLVTGSLFLVGEALSMLDAARFEVSAQ